MTIKAMPGPTDGPSAIRDALANLKPPWGAKSVMATAPLQIFYAGLGDVRDSHFLSMVTPVGWRYIIVSREENGAAIATVDLDTDDRQRVVDVGSIISGPLAKGLLEASRVAETVAETFDGSYEPRVLDIPTLYICALRLHGPEDVFIPLPDDLDRDRPQLDPAFVEHVRSAAEAHGLNRSDN
jgi:hypothetical protein